MACPSGIRIALILLAAIAARAQDNVVQDLIDAALRQGAREVVIPPGSYEARNGKHFLFRKVKDFTVRADGAKVVLKVRKTALLIEDCENLEIRGLTLDYDPLPFTQGTIAAAGPGWSYADVELHAGYPREKPAGARIEVKDRASLLLKPDIMMIYGTQVDSLGPGRFRFHGTEGFQGKAAVGDYLVDHYPDQGGYHGIEMLRSVNTVLRDFTFHSSPGYAAHTYECDGGAFLNFRFTPGPPPPGATVPRLRTGHADGIHCENARRGPRFEDCLIEANGDDGIAIHGDFARLASAVAGGRVLTVDTLRYLHLRLGDTVVGLNAANGFAFQAVAAAVSGSQVTLDRDVTAPAGGRLYNANAIGSGYVLRNNVTRNHRARGFLLRGHNGVVEGNTVDWVQEAGIGLFPEWGIWAQSGLSRGIRITGNTIRRAALVGWARAVDISVPGDPAAGAFRDILFAGNTVDSCPGLNLLVSSAAGVVIRDNAFRNVQASRDGVIRLHNGEDIALSGNCVAGAAPGKDILSVGDVVGLMGRQDGVRNGCVMGIDPVPLLAPAGGPPGTQAWRDAAGRLRAGPARKALRFGPKSRR